MKNHLPAPWRCAHISTEPAPNNDVYSFEVYSERDWTVRPDFRAIGGATALVIAQAPTMLDILNEVDTAIAVLGVSGSTIAPQAVAAIDAVWPKVAYALYAAKTVNPPSFEEWHKGRKALKADLDKDTAHKADNLPTWPHHPE